jgi:hypothetical protein
VRLRQFCFRIRLARPRLVASRHDSGTAGVRRHRDRSPGCAHPDRQRRVRNHLVPTAGGTPASSAASSLSKPTAIAAHVAAHLVLPRRVDLATTMAPAQTDPRGNNHKAEVIVVSDSLRAKNWQTNEWFWSTIVRNHIRASPVLELEACPGRHHQQERARTFGSRRRSGSGAKRPCLRATSIFVRSSMAFRPLSPS